MTYDQKQPVQTDALGAIRKELVDAARRRILARRRRRRALGIITMAAGLFTFTGGALALTDVDTGVPAIDRFLGASSERAKTMDTLSQDSANGNAVSEDPTQKLEAGAPSNGHDSLPPGVTPPTPPALSPTAGSTSLPLEVSLGNGASALAVGFQTSDGVICSALADPDEPIGPPRGSVSCIGTSILKEVLREKAARIVGGSAADSSTLIVQGFTREDVRDVTVVGPSLRVRAALSDPWTPGSWQGGPLRVFSAAVNFGEGGDALSPQAAGLTLETRLVNGTTVEGASD